MAAIHVVMLILGLAAWHMEEVAGDCCSAVTWYANSTAPTLPGGSYVATFKNSGLSRKWDRCADCSKDGTYCGVGSCNPFGCNCNGGCRIGTGICYCYKVDCIPPPCGTFDPPAPSASQHTAENIVKMADVNQDGRLSYEEARAFLGRILTVNDYDLQALDVNKDGYFTAEEIDPSG